MGLAGAAGGPLVIRYGLAGNSLGKRTFFLGNDTRAERDNAAAAVIAAKRTLASAEEAHLREITLSDLVDRAADQTRDMYYI